MKGRRNMRLEVIHGSRTVPKAEQHDFLVVVSDRVLARNEEARLARRMARLERVSPELRTVERAKLVVEQCIVEALWALSRMPNGQGIGYAKRNGVGYFHDYADKVEQAKAAGWLSSPPAPSPPTAKEVDLAENPNGPLSWCRLIDRDQAMLLWTVASGKRGDVTRHVSWDRVKKVLPRYVGLHPRTLQRRYEQALRDIVSHLTIARIG